MAGFDDFGGPFQPKWFCDAVLFVCALCEGVFPSSAMDTEQRPFPDMLRPPPAPRLIPFLRRETLLEERLFLSEVTGAHLLMPGGKEQAKNLAIKSDSCITMLSNRPGDEMPVQNFSGDKQGSCADVHLRDGIIVMLHLFSTRCLVDQLMPWTTESMVDNKASLLYSTETSQSCSLLMAGTILGASKQEVTAGSKERKSPSVH